MSGGSVPTVPITMADDAGGARDDKLAERVTQLERRVLEDPYRPKETILARLESLEETVRRMAKADEATSKLDTRASDQQRKEQERHTKEHETLDRRLKDVEKGRGGTTDPADIRELRKEADALRRSVDDLKVRVGRLESKR